jgi:hypothetical protein
MMDGYAFETLSWLLVHWLVDTDPARFNRFLTQWPLQGGRQGGTAGHRRIER